MNIMKLIVLILISATSVVLSIPVSPPRLGDSHDVEQLRLRRNAEGVEGPVNLVTGSGSPTGPATGDLDTADTFIGLYGGWGGFGGYGGYGGFGYPYGGYGGYGFGYPGYGGYIYG